MGPYNLELDKDVNISVKISKDGEIKIFSELGGAELTSAALLTAYFELLSVSNADSALDQLTMLIQFINEITEVEDDED